MTNGTNDDIQHVRDFLNELHQLEGRLDRIQQMLAAETLLFAINIADYEEWGPIPLPTDYVRDKLSQERFELMDKLVTYHIKLQRILEIIREA